MGENEAVRFFQRWWPNAERRALRGIMDAGDVAGTPYIIEVKRCESWPLQKWIAELKAAKANAGNPNGILMMRKSRTGWYFLVDSHVMKDLLDAAYGASGDVASD